MYGKDGHTQPLPTSGVPEVDMAPPSSESLPLTYPSCSVAYQDRKVRTN